MPENIVIVGAGLAGLRTAQELRRRGSDARITLIGDEIHPPYDRPPLSKQVLLGKVEPESTRLIDAAALSDLDLDLRLGTTATGLDLVARRVMLADGHADFDKLIIATGSGARSLPGTEHLSGVHVLRTLQHAADIRAALEGRPRVVVIGGGFIGAEVAATARDLDLEVAVVDPLPVLMQRGLGDVLGERLTQRHRDHGVQLHLGRTVAQVLGGSAVEGVRLDDGTELAADLVVVGIGGAPNTAWLEGSGLTIDNGVVCDEYLRAADGVFAVGDVARWHHPLYGEAIRAEHWTVAGEHAAAVAATLTGEPTVSAEVPYVWTDQFGRKIQIVGRVQPGDEVRYLLDEPERFVALTGSDGHQHAAVGLAAPGPVIKQRRALATGAPWPPSTDA